MAQDNEKLSVIYDLHCHTRASDGDLTPLELVDRAVLMGVDVLAITDHDTVNGILPARHHIDEKNKPLTLIAGVEISTIWQKIEIHIVGLNLNLDADSLKHLLAMQTTRRNQRGEKIGYKLEKFGIPDAWQNAKAYAAGGQVTRSHFARYIMDHAKQKSIGHVFKKYLTRGKPGYVPADWCSLAEAIEVIHQAGGVAVLAHPGRYSLSAKWQKRLVLYFKQQQGDAIEVAQCQQSPEERKNLTELARLHNLYASVGSDFHRPCAWTELGRNLWLPAGVVPVWQIWQ
ncbi:RNase RNM [Arsenophonus apicola]|uniref:PHP domain-containing protein n=1 Tax=Arsenophonus apicola TaxID=2879119 RepID=A0ABY8NZI9_9GAMM|nr:PHP domain-containing protein [Arsenophonus apicola]WGO82394.1 PHP domain-containing protein [Arsenophonus apicola]